MRLSRDSPQHGRTRSRERGPSGPNHSTMVAKQAERAPRNARPSPRGRRVPIDAEARSVSTMTTAEGSRTTVTTRGASTIRSNSNSTNASTARHNSSTAKSRDPQGVRASPSPRHKTKLPLRQGRQPHRDVSASPSQRSFRTRSPSPHSTINSNSTTPTAARLSRDSFFKRGGPLGASSNASTSNHKSQVHEIPSTVVPVPIAVMPVVLRNSSKSSHGGRSSNKNNHKTSNQKMTSIVDAPEGGSGIEEIVSDESISFQAIMKGMEQTAYTRAAQKKGTYPNKSNNSRRPRAANCEDPSSRGEPISTVATDSKRVLNQPIRQLLEQGDLLPQLSLDSDSSYTSIGSITTMSTRLSTKQQTQVIWPVAPNGVLNPQTVQPASTEGGGQNVAGIHQTPKYTSMLAPLLGKKKKLQGKHSVATESKRSGSFHSTPQDAPAGGTDAPNKLDRKPDAPEQKQEPSSKQLATEQQEEEDSQPRQGIAIKEIRIPTPSAARRGSQNANFFGAASEKDTIRELAMVFSACSDDDDDDDKPDPPPKHKTTKRSSEQFCAVSDDEESTSDSSFDSRDDGDLSTADSTSFGDSTISTKPKKAERRIWSQRSTKSNPMDALREKAKSFAKAAHDFGVTPRASNVASTATPRSKRSSSKHAKGTPRASNVNLKHVPPKAKAKAKSSAAKKNRKASSSDHFFPKDNETQSVQSELTTDHEELPASNESNDEGYSCYDAVDYGCTALAEVGVVSDTIRRGFGMTPKSSTEKGEGLDVVKEVADFVMCQPESAVSQSILRPICNSSAKPEIVLSCHRGIEVSLVRSDSGETQETQDTAVGYLKPLNWQGCAGEADHGDGEDHSTTSSVDEERAWGLVQKALDSNNSKHLDTDDDDSTSDGTASTTTTNFTKTKKPKVSTVESQSVTDASGSSTMLGESTTFEGTVEEKSGEDSSIDKSDGGTEAESLWTKKHETDNLNESLDYVGNAFASIASAGISAAHQVSKTADDITAQESESTSKNVELNRSGSPQKTQKHSTTEKKRSESPQKSPRKSRKESKKSESPRKSPRKGKRDFKCSESPGSSGKKNNLGFDNHHELEEVSTMTVPESAMTMPQSIRSRGSVERSPACGTTGSTKQTTLANQKPIRDIVTAASSGSTEFTGADSRLRIKSGRPGIQRSYSSDASISGRHKSRMAPERQELRRSYSSDGSICSRERIRVLSQKPDVFLLQKRETKELNPADSVSLDPSCARRLEELDTIVNSTQPDQRSRHGLTTVTTFTTISDGSAASDSLFADLSRAKSDLSRQKAIGKGNFKTDDDAFGLVAFKLLTSLSIMKKQIASLSPDHENLNQELVAILPSVAQRLQFVEGVRHRLSKMPSTPSSLTETLVRNCAEGGFALEGMSNPVLAYYNAAEHNKNLFETKSKDQTVLSEHDVPNKNANQVSGKSDYSNKLAVSHDIITSVAPSCDVSTLTECDGTRVTFLSANELSTIYRDEGDAGTKATYTTADDQSSRRVVSVLEEPVSQIPAPKKMSEDEKMEENYTLSLNPTEDSSHLSIDRSHLSADQSQISVDKSTSSNDTSHLFREAEDMVGKMMETIQEENLALAQAELTPRAKSNPSPKPMKKHAFFSDTETDDSDFAEPFTPRRQSPRKKPPQVSINRAEVEVARKPFTSPRKRISSSPRPRQSQSPRGQPSPSIRRKQSQSPRRRPSASPRRRQSASPRKAVDVQTNHCSSPRKQKLPSPRKKIDMNSQYSMTTMSVSSSDDETKAETEFMAASSIDETSKPKMAGSFSFNLSGQSTEESTVAEVEGNWKTHSPCNKEKNKVPETFSFNLSESSDDAKDDTRNKASPTVADSFSFNLSGPSIESGEELHEPSSNCEKVVSDSVSLDLGSPTKEQRKPSLASASNKAELEPVDELLSELSCSDDDTKTDRSEFFSTTSADGQDAKDKIVLKPSKIPPSNDKTTVGNPAESRVPVKLNFAYSDDDTKTDSEYMAGPSVDDDTMNSEFMTTTSSIKTMDDDEEEDSIMDAEFLAAMKRNHPKTAGRDRFIATSPATTLGTAHKVVVENTEYLPEHDAPTLDYTACTSDEETQFIDNHHSPEHVQELALGSFD